MARVQRMQQAVPVVSVVASTKTEAGESWKP